MAAPRPVKRLPPAKPIAPASLSRPQDMYAVDWDNPNREIDQLAQRNKMQRVIERGNPGVKRTQK